MKLLKIIFTLSAIVFLNSCSSNEEKPIALPDIDFCAQLHPPDSNTLEKELASVDSLMQKKTGVFVLENGETAMITRAWLSEHAQKTIDVQYFIFSTDNVGLIACDYLVRAANKGVKVRILVDDIMVEASGHELATMDAHKNIEIKVYNPGVKTGKTIWQRIKKFETEFVDANQRMHNKTFIVDDKVGITGGRNIADEYFDYDHEYNFRDRDVLLLGKTVKKMKAAFNQFWEDSISVAVADLISDSNAQKNSTNLYEALHQYACNPENFWPQIREEIKNLPDAFHAIQKSGDLIWTDSVEFISDIPGKFIKKGKSLGGGITTARLVQLVSNAKQSISIQSPYLITGDLGLRLFTETCKKNVRVKILTNSLASTDNLEAFAGYQTCREALLKTGIRIFEFKPNAACRYKLIIGDLQKKEHFSPIFGLHAKSMVIDDSITVIGTFNLDPRSAHFNTECVAVIHSKTIAKKVKAQMEIEIQAENAWETTLNYNPDKEAGVKKEIKSWTRKIVPKNIL
jgi:cardiolipin synthase C